jgi:DNA-binding response OmpR family regulator
MPSPSASATTFQKGIELSDAFKVFAIDDDPLILEIMREILEPDCAVETFESVEACLPRLEVEKPGMFLLDVSLPGMDGYAFCRVIKDDESLRDIPVTFVSSNDTIEARIKGYDAGGEDFIVKPFEPEEVLRKIKVAKQIILSKKALEEQAKAANSFSMMMMTSMGESGIVMQFLGKLFSWNTEQEVAAGVLELLQSYQLEGVTQTRIAQRTLTLSASGTNMPLEVSVLNHVRSQGRIFEFRNRGVYNTSHITVMVNNMPVHDPDLCGRLRDHLSLVAQGADSRLQAIEAEEANQRNRAGIDAALQSIRESVSAMRQAHGLDRAASSQLLIELEQSMAKAFVHLGLSTDQERHMEDLVHAFMKRMMELQDRGEEIYETLQQLTEKLGQLK